MMKNDSENTQFSKKSNIVMTIIFIVVIGIFAVASFAKRPVEFSENENRSMTLFPDITWDSFVEGSLQDKLESYLNDQVLGRDTWISVKSWLQKCAGNTDIGGAYVGSNGYDFEKILPEDVDSRLVETNIYCVNEYLKSAATQVGEDHVSALIIPTSGLVMEQYLPSNAILFDQNAVFDQIAAGLTDCNLVDAREALVPHADEYIYYRTDHHWTTAGSLYGYALWKERMLGQAVDVNAYEQQIVTDEFRGSLYSKVLDIDSAYDSVWRYTWSGMNDSLTVTANGEALSGMFDESALGKKDKYLYFFGGNYGELVIAGGQGTGNLLIIKDSFANSFAPLVANDFAEVHMIDLRYYGGDVNAYIEENGITDVLVLYNMSNFVSDRNLYKLIPQ